VSKRPKVKTETRHWKLLLWAAIVGLALGLMFNDAEDRAHARVAVLGSEVLPLLGVDNPMAILDERIRIAGRQFTVVGILAARGVSGVGDADQQVLIPFSTGRFQVFGTDRIQDIWVRAVDESAVVDATIEVQQALRRSHRLRILEIGKSPSE